MHSRRSTIRTSKAMSTQELPQNPSAVEPFIFHTAQRRNLAEHRPPAPLRRSLPGTGEGALVGMILVTLCLAGVVNGLIHRGGELPFLWPTAAIFLSLDAWFLRVMIRLARQEAKAKRLFDQGQTLRGSL